MELHNKTLNDHLYMKEQSMVVDYEMVDLEHQQDHTLKNPNLKRKKKYTKHFDSCFITGLD